jgi:hypothetical protein
MKVNLHELFYDLDGKPITAARHRDLFPQGRVTRELSQVLGVAISTEFVGINHNSDGDGKPWIFETIAQIDGDIMYSRWCSHEYGAVQTHAAVALASWVTLSLGWHLWHQLRMARVRVHRWLS